jgi:hypothetical protein
MTALGIAITGATLLILAVELLRHRRRALEWHGWVALAALLGAGWLLSRRIELVATYFTPIAWTCWIFFADALVRAMDGRGEPSAERGGGKKNQANEGRTEYLWSGKPAIEKVLITALSVPLWLIFEAYNLRLVNWTYVGLPENLVARYLGYGWAFATITPAIFVTADLVQSFGWLAKPVRAVKYKSATLRWMTAVGALLLAVPLVTPMPAAAYLFAPVWLGFVFLLDPVNYRLGLPSLVGDLERGHRERLYSLLISGWVCGWLWEFWNYWAAAKWLYIFPMFQEWKIFEMPAPGFLGFPPFALECFTMYVTARWLVGGRKPVAAKLGTSQTAD